MNLLNILLLEILLLEILFEDIVRNIGSKYFCKRIVARKHIVHFEITNNLLSREVLIKIVRKLERLSTTFYGKRPQTSYSSQIIVDSCLFFLESLNKYFRKMADGKCGSFAVEKQT